MVEISKKIAGFVASAEQLSSRLTTTNQILKNLNAVELTDVAAIMKGLDDFHVSGSFSIS